MNDYPSWIEPADYDIAFFAGVRRVIYVRGTYDYYAFGREQPREFINRYSFGNIKSILAGISPFNDFGVKHNVITIDGCTKCSYAAFIRLTHDKFRAIRTILPLPIANEIWTHFDPVFVKRVYVE